MIPVQRNLFRERTRKIIENSEEVQPNDPCPCGKCYPDGRPIKYKNCCGRNQ